MTTTLTGGTGNDTYSYASGNGVVSIVDSGGINLLRLGGGMTFPNVKFGQSGDDLVITDGVSGDRIDIAGQFATSGSPVVQSLVLGDGTTLSLQHVVIGGGGGNVNGTSGSDILVGDSNDVLLNGLGDGNDVFIGGSNGNEYDGAGGNDIMVGGTGGVDNMFAGNGDNTIIFTQGPTSQYVAAGTGNDTYSYTAGDGAVSITDSGGTNILHLGSGISASTIQFQQNIGENDIEIIDGVSGDTITLLNEDPYSAIPTIPTLMFSDGSTLNIASGIALSGPASYLVGTVGDDTLIATGTGYQSLNGAGGNDTFIGGDGQEDFDATGDTSATFVFGHGYQRTFAGTGNYDYSYAAGDGTAILSYGGSGTGTLHLGAGLSLADLTWGRPDGNLLIKDGTAGDSIIATAGVQTIVFSDGTTLSLTTSAGEVVTGSGNGTFNGTWGDDTLIGGSGSEILDGADGNNTFIAGTGTETLIGGLGNDTYSYASGDGIVTIRDFGGANILRLGSGMTFPNVKFSQSGDDLVITDGVSGDRIDIAGQFATSGSPVVQSLVLGDGTTLSLQHVVIGGGGGNVNGTSGSDILVGDSNDVLLNGLGDGNDVFIGGSNGNEYDGAGGNDIMVGGTGGVDNMFAGNGDNTIIFTQGPTSQYVAAGTGNDTYSYTAGDGAVSITDSGGTNILHLGSGISASTIQFQQNIGENDIEIIDGVSGDTITLLNEDPYSAIPTIPTLMFSDGSTLNITSGIALSGPAGYLVGTVGDDTLIATGTGYQSLNGAGGNDTFIGGDGQEDFDATGDTSATFIFGHGYQRTFAGTGNYDYSYAAGDGTAILSYGGSGTGTLHLGAGLSLSDLSFSNPNGNLLITDGTTGDSIIATAGVQTIVFSDGSTFDLSAMSGEAVTASGDGAFNGTWHDDTLIGGTGNETLNGGGGNDTFIAGTGTETLIGGVGNDTYSYASGDGVVTIQDSGGTNILRLGSGMTFPNVKFSQSGNDLVITDGVSGDRIDIAGQFATSGSPVVQSLVLGDGTTLSLQHVVIGGVGGGNVNGTSGNDILVGDSNDVLLNGLGGGNDVFIGGSNGNEYDGAAGNDIMIGGTGGVDNMFAGNGDNTIIFTQGPTSQYVAAGTGNDTYSYAAGDGAVSITDSGGTNILHLGSGISRSTIQFQQNTGPNDLEIVDGVSGDTITLLNEDPYSAIPTIPALMFSDGSTLNIASGIALSGPASYLVGTVGDDTLIATGTGYQSLNGAGGNDTFIGGDGQEDFDATGDSSATFIFGHGFQRTFVGTGNYDYSYAAGDGTAILSYGGSGTGTLHLGAGLSLSDLSFSSPNGNLLITDGTAGDSIIATAGVQTIAFADSTTLPLTGTHAVTGSGDGAFYGTWGDDTLTGGSGTETLQGISGNDNFIAGTGTETLLGGTGNDSYSYASGDGAVTIKDLGGTNLLQLGSGIANDQLWFAQSDNDLLVTVIGTTQTLDIKDWFSGTPEKNIAFETSDSKTLQSSQVINLVNAMAGLTPPSLGQTTLPTDEATQLEPVIAANWH